MINHLGDLYEDTVIVDSENDAKMNFMTFNPNSTVLKARWVYI